MAFKPSSRRKGDNKYKEPDLLVVMNLMVCLIPLLLSCAEFVKLGTLELVMPESSGGGGGGSSNPNVEVKKNLELKVLITEAGFTIQSNLRGIEPNTNGDPNSSISVRATSLPQEDEHYYREMYDFKALTAKMVSIKKEIEGAGYSDDTNVQISASDGIKYQLIVSTIDAVQYQYDEKTKEKSMTLFNSVGLSAAL